MIRKLIPSKFVAAFFAIAFFILAQQSARAATIVIQNNDQPSVGFNDPTPASPVGNNTGTTLGQQRLNAFQFAANLWGATLNSNVTITIQASWASLGCPADGPILGQAGTVSFFSNFPNAPQGNTWYPGALANALSGNDLNPNSPEIKAQFNTDIGQATCLGGTPFYLGLDNNFGSGIDLVAVLMHEFAHGLGFQSFYNPKDGSEPQNIPGIFDFFLRDNSIGKTWNNMTNAERLTSATNTGNLVWIGSRSINEARNVLGTARVIVNAPSSATINASGEAYSPDIRARQLALNAGTTTAQVTGSVATTSPADACSTISSAVAGKIALIDRGTCNFTVKVKNAQNAGAIGAVIANIASSTNMPIMGGADSTVAIPAVLISFNDGNTLKGQLGSGLNVSLVTDASLPVGTDAQGHPRMYAPNPLAEGSSVSHWDDVEFPDLLMEPSNTGDTIHSVAVPADLTLAQLRDIGWSGNPIGDNAFLVRQQYLDFLNRQPDSSGYQFWANNIFNCVVDSGCAEVHRINNSGAFFLSIEFQQTGFYVLRIQRVAFGRRSKDPATRMVMSNWLRDVSQVSNGVIVLQPGWEQVLENNKQAYATQIVNSPEFATKYAPTLNANDYVDALIASAAVPVSTSEKNAAITAFGGGGTSGRVAALRSIADVAQLTQQGSETLPGGLLPTLATNEGVNREFREAFVLMQYFGYLRRDPDDSGYQFWLYKMNQFGGNFTGAEMVKAFLASDEYRHRFGS